MLYIRSKIVCDSTYCVDCLRTRFAKPKICATRECHRSDVLVLILVLKTIFGPMLESLFVRIPFLKLDLN
jgi:hypothetical protein